MLLDSTTWGGEGGEGGPVSQNKAAFNCPGRERQEGGSGKWSQLGRKNWFRVASPGQTERRLVLSAGSLPKTCGPWGAGGTT